MMAAHHVRSGRLVVERQRALIRRGQEAGRNTDASEDLLALFERTQAIFEDDLARLRRPPGASWQPG